MKKMSMLDLYMCVSGYNNMAFYGLTSYDRCKKLIEILKKENIDEINEEDLARYIAIYIGSSTYYKTIRNYIKMLIAFKMIESLGNQKFKINHGILNDQ